MAEELKLTTRLLRGALFYSITIVLGVALALSELDQGRADNFLRYSAAVLLVLVIELYLGWSEQQTKARQTKLPHIDQLSRQSKFLHHLVLPLTAYLSILGFAYYNRQAHLRLLIFTLALAVFTILFINIRAYYAHTVKVLESTHFVYDIIKLLIFFCAADSFFNISISLAQPAVAGLGVIIISIGLMLLMLMRYDRLELTSLILVIVVSVVLGVLAYFLQTQGRFNPIQIAMMSFLTFYVGSAAIHHEMDHNLTGTIILEYAAILTIAISILYGLSS